MTTSATLSHLKHSESLQVDLCVEFDDWFLTKPIFLWSGQNSLMRVAWERFPLLSSTVDAQQTPQPSNRFGITHAPQGLSSFPHVVTPPLVRVWPIRSDILDRFLGWVDLYSDTDSWNFLIESDSSRKGLQFTASPSIDTQSQSHLAHRIGLHHQRLQIFAILGLSISDPDMMTNLSTIGGFNQIRWIPTWPLERSLFAKY